MLRALDLSFPPLWITILLKLLSEEFMYGSIFRMKIKDGKEREFIKHMDDFEKIRKPKVKGYLGTFILISEKKTDEILGVAIFTSKAAYFKNAKDPEQDKWYRKMRTYLKADPEWNDGEYVRAEYLGKTHSVEMH